VKRGAPTTDHRGNLVPQVLIHMAISLLFILLMKPYMHVYVIYILGKLLFNSQKLPIIIKGG
jgi:hypothetical protein